MADCLIIKERSRTMLRKVSLIAVLCLLLPTKVFAEEASDEKRIKSIPVGSSSYHSFSIPATDEFSLKAIYRSKYKIEAPSVILVHEAKRDQWSWGSDLCAEFLHGNINILHYDSRGHGISVKGTPIIKNHKIVGYVDGYKVTWRDFCSRGEDNGWNKMTGDLGLMVDWLRRNDRHIKGECAIIGAGVGANTALRYAADDEKIAGLVLLSPSLNYNDVKTTEPAHKWNGRPCLIICSRKDSKAVESARKLQQIMREVAGNNRDNIRLMILEGAARGTDMLDEKVNREIVAWVTNLLNE